MKVTPTVRGYLARAAADARAAGEDPATLATLDEIARLGITAPGTQVDEREVDEFRIEYRKPRARKWHYAAGTFTSARDLPHARRQLARITDMSSAGWRYRIVRRHVKVIRQSTDWEEVT